MSDLTPETLAELRRRAEACPTPDSDPDILSEWYEIEDLTGRNYPIPPLDAAFIAAASPDVVLGLLDRLGDVWDEGHADGLHDAHEYREHRKARNPYRPETTAGRPETAPEPTNNPNPTPSAP